jgi:hypothetical protein
MLLYNLVNLVSPKNEHVLLIATLAQLDFYRSNSYFVDRREHEQDFISCGVLWPPLLLAKLTPN